MKSKLLFGIIAAVVMLAVSCATFKGEIPVKTGLPETVYISPKNADGIQDELIIDLEIPVLELLVIQGYRFTVFTADQVAVYSVENEAAKSERKTGVKIPEYLSWDGKDANGEYVPDGNYIYKIEAWDRYKNAGSTEFLYVVVDNVPPSVELTAATDIFSPNGDGRLDVFPVSQLNGSTEQLWTGTFRNSSNTVVRTLSWEDRPADFEWDGLDDAGMRIPDGVYGYVLSSTDLAGNTGKFTVSSIQLDTRPTPIALTTNVKAFSPNGDGKLDALEFKLHAELTDNVLGWRVDIADAANQIVQTFAQSGVPPESLVFDGKNEKSATLADGFYSGVFNVTYRNGDSPITSTDPFVIDTVAPAATVKVEYQLFSPDGDGNLDTLPIQQSSSVESLWEAHVADSAGKQVARWFWLGEVKPVIWTGLDAQGAKVADGRYRYVLVSTDEAGNSGRFEIDSIRTDTRPTPVTLLIDTPAFSPRAGSAKGTMKFLPNLLIDQDVKGWQIQILDATKTAVRTIKGTGLTGNEIIFDGRNDKGFVVPDGSYAGVLSVEYQKGNRVSAESPLFVVDTIAPIASISTEYLLFSPDGDGRKDSITLFQSSSVEDLWTGTILDASGRAVITRTWRGRTTPFEWNGRTSNGAAAANGAYSYRLVSSDRAGNSTTAEVRGIRIDTSVTPVTVKTVSAGVSPNGDGIMDTIRLELTAQVTAGIKSWNLGILNSARLAIKSYTGGGQVPASVSWDGRDNGAAVAADGTYTAEFSIEYEKGNLPVSRSTTFVVDTRPPTVSVSASPLPFSPDGDGEADTVVLTIRAEDTNGIDSWNADIIDPAGNHFISFKGTGAPRAPITWDGRSSSGELVQSADDYTTVVMATDKLGNKGRTSAKLPVDILVQRIGDKLKIVISSIYFKPFTADFMDVDPDVARKNVQTIDRLAEVLKKYAGYGISLEGHAVRIYWNNPIKLVTEEAEVLVPLSVERAQVIKDALTARGVAESRMSVYGFGGTQPVVPHGDLENRWKNRRVEFILQKK